MFDHNRIPAQRTTESMSEHLRDKAIKQRPKRMPGEKEERAFKELSEEWENEKKKTANRSKKEGESFLDVIGKGDDPKFSRRLVKKAMESGKATEHAGRDFSPKLSEEDVALLKDEPAVGQPVKKEAAANPLRGEKELTDKEPTEPSPTATHAPRAQEGPVKQPEIAALTPEEPKPKGEVHPVKKPKAAEKLVAASAPNDDAAEQVAASQVPAAAVNEAAPAQNAPRPAAPMHKELHEVVEKMVAQLQTVTSTDRTETVITLGQSGVFKGAEVTLTEFSSAKGEFNVSFTNLSPEAKALVDNPENQGNLKQAMESRGYPLHIIVTSAQDRETLIAEAQETFDREDQQGQGRGQQEQEAEEDEA